MTHTQPIDTLISDRYRLFQRLGRGGMSVVFRAWDTRLQVWRAVKVLSPKMLGDEAIELPGAESFED